MIHAPNGNLRMKRKRRGAEDTMAEPTMSMFTEQWRMTRMQLVNWGTFCGYHDFPIEAFGKDGEPPVVMITGESGTGKSTLFDAKTAVLQKYNVAFNTASNAFQRGRARSGNQRNLFTYVLGKQDDVYDDEAGEELEVRLRPTTAPQWSAIVLSFEDMHGAVFTAARFFFVPAQGQESDLRQFMLTANEDLDPRNLESRLTQSVNKKLLMEVYPSAKVHDTVSGFLGTVYGHMQIGPDAEGDNAMKLHQRIQGGYPITDVDALFKELVIDDPSTFNYAKRALDSFRESESVWVQMDEVRQKIQDLGDIRKNYESFEENRARFELMDSMLGEDDGPLSLWISRRLSEVASNALEKLDGELRELRQLEDKKTGELEAVKVEFDALAREIQSKGGDAIDRRREQLKAARSHKEACELAFAQMEQTFDRARHKLPANETAFRELQEESKTFVEACDARSGALEEEKLQVRIRADELRAREEDAQNQLRYYREHPVNITPEMAQARDKMAKALGVAPDMLPYAAELMDMPPEEEAWRLAACVGYHGLAMQVLVDERRLDELSVAIDKLKLGKRVSFQGVDVTRSYNAEPRKGWLSSKIVVKEGSPFSNWLASELSSPKRDYECVDGPEDLPGEHAKIDLEGQTRKGMRGAHGYNKRNTLIIGFTNEALVAQLVGELERIAEALVETDAQIKDVAKRQKLLEYRRDAARWMLQHSFAQVDIASAEERIRELEDEIGRLEGDDTLKTLIARRDAMALEVDRMTRELGAVDRECEHRRDDIQNMQQRKDAATRRVAELEGVGLAVTSVQESCIDGVARGREEALLGETGKAWEALAFGYEAVEAGIRSDLSSKRTQALKFKTMAENTLANAFRGYHDRWLGEDDPTGVTVESYPDYLRMLEELEADRLNEPRDRWLRTLFVQTASTLVPLTDAFGKDLRTIHNRMEPINQIMERFDFGPDHGSLRIAVRNRERAQTERFRRELGRWASLATRVDEVEQGESTHRELRRFMKTLEEELARGSKGVLNTKNLVSITVMASYPDASGKKDNTYSSLDAKSGGETQELIAFILGAALLFCLGRNTQGLPSFSPVFLDEAFVKADEHFTQRAIRALSGLGFQVIIAVPTSKVQAVEPVANQYVCITKNRAGQSFITPMSRRVVADAKRDEKTSSHDA